MIGIPYVRSINCEEAKLQQWNVFWAYFAKTWVTTYRPATWNIAGMDPSDIGNRTNNGVECYNRRLKADIVPHPKMAVFIETIKQHAYDFILELQLIDAGRGRKMPHAGVTMYTIPQAYLDFIPPKPVAVEKAATAKPKTGKTAEVASSAVAADPATPAVTVVIAATAPTENPKKRQAIEAASSLVLLFK